MQDDEHECTEIEVDVDEPARDKVKQARGAISPTPSSPEMALDELIAMSAPDHLPSASKAAALPGPTQPAAADQPWMGSPAGMEDAESHLPEGSPMEAGRVQTPQGSRERVRSGSKGRGCRVGALGIQGQARREPMHPSPQDKVSPFTMQHVSKSQKPGQNATALENSPGQICAADLHSGL